MYTVRGHHAHERAHGEGGDTDAGVRVERGLPLWSDRLGLIGKADVVEFREAPYPVEYKVGRRRGPHEDIQLAAQAVCLEEMFGVAVPEGAVFYFAARRRHKVVIDEALRRAVAESAAGVRAMLAGMHMPDAVNDARCPRCSLIDVCLPAVVSHPRRITLLHTALFRDDG